MLEAIEGLPDGVVGFEAVGDVQAADYEEILAPAIARLAARGDVRLVLVLGSRFAGYSIGAVTQDAGLVAHADRWKRTALVSDLAWVTHLATVFGWMVPGRFQRFPLAERDAAIAWASGGD